jgi:hypothetical protein
MRPIKKYQVTIKTLNHEEYEYGAYSCLSEEELTTHIFDQTPNVRGVTVTPFQQI